ncbi:MAG: hypothetical protein CSYNP_03132 [Syntrophus sp. SKADARSKE-3]|nr:hypothetical protein [Syntrophus sp. SKADARSKE-3]
MKIQSLKIRNFKTFNDEGISLSLTDLTALVGENSTGKSNILEALDLFFNFSSTKISKESFHHDDNSKEISIQIGFSMLSEPEKKMFNVHLNEKKDLEITQIIKLNVGEDSDDEGKEKYEENKHGTRWESPLEWSNLTGKNPTKTNIKAWWKTELKIGDFDFKSFFDGLTTEPSPEVYQEKLEKLWEEQFDIIPKEKKIGEEKVLGWKSKLKKNLPKYFYIPAVKDVNDDLRVNKTNPFGEIIGWLTKNITADIEKDFKTKTNTIFKEVMETIDKDNDGNSKINYLNEQLNANLGINLDCKLELKFGTPSMSDVIFPSPQLYANDGYYSVIDLKGNGLQRLCILSLLRTYNDIKKRMDNADRNVIIAIEEPEIYLHPPVKRATYKLLRSLSEKTDQIIYSTHDGYFVSVEHFDEIRIFRKTRTDKPKTIVYEFSIDKLLNYYKNCLKIETISEKSLRHKFSHICDETKNEGFFANKIIIIEGETEKYALPIYFVHKGFDLDNERIAIISAGSVDNITYLYAIFNEFNIPCYIIFDGDKPSQDQLTKIKTESKETADLRKNIKGKSKRNKELLSFLGESISETDYVFPPTSVNNRYAVWEINFEDTFHKSIDIYPQLKGEAKDLYATDSKPLTGRYIASELVQKYPDKIFNQIATLIDKIKACQWVASCLIQKGE